MSALPLLVLLLPLGALPPGEGPPPKPPAAEAPAGDVAVEVVVGRGETLAQVAARTLGEARAEAELRALNGLPPGRVRPGTRLRLPGPERARAQSALSAARAAITQREAGGSKEALARLDEAERLFLAARYDEAAQVADAAWALVSGAAAPVRFSVSVDADAGVTQVDSHGGMPLRVESQGTTRSVRPGERVRVARGRAPPPAVAQRLPAPRPLAPARAAVLRRAPTDDGGLRPVQVRWAAVPGAERYAVEVHAVDGRADAASARGRTWTVEARGTEAALPPLPAGRYRWRVWAVHGEQRGEPGPAHTFTLEEERLELDVKGSTWK